MSGPNRRVRPMALAAPLTLVAAVVSLGPIAAGAHLMAHGASAPSIAQVAASHTSVTHHHKRPASKASGSPAVYEPKWAPSRTHAPHHPRRHSPRSTNHRPAHSRRANRPHGDQALLHH